MEGQKGGEGARRQREENPFIFPQLFPSLLCPTLFFPLFPSYPVPFSHLLSLKSYFSLAQFPSPLFLPASLFQTLFLPILPSTGLSSSSLHSSRFSYCFTSLWTFFLVASFFSLSQTLCPSPFSPNVSPSLPFLFALPIHSFSPPTLYLSPFSLPNSTISSPFLFPPLIFSPHLHPFLLFLQSFSTLPNSLCSSLHLCSLLHTLSLLAHLRPFRFLFLTALLTVLHPPFLSFFLPIVSSLAHSSSPIQFTSVSYLFTPFLFPSPTIFIFTMIMFIFPHCPSLPVPYLHL